MYWCLNLPKLGDMSSIPEDIVVDILLRLPVKSIIRFKSVCKGWCALIESPEFVNRHFAHGNNPERLLVRHFKDIEDYSFRLYSDVTDSTREEPEHLQIPSAVKYILGPVNGVFCMINTWNQMALLNPATRQFRPIPLAFPEVKRHFNIGDELYGFGIDPLTGHFKVVSISLLMSSRTEPRDGFICVYNSGTDCWSEIEDVEFVNIDMIRFRSPGNNYLNGVYYWLDCRDVVVILAFDMSSESFRVIQAPQSIRSGGVEVMISRYQDSIALLQWNVDTHVHVWTMESEGCWIKSLILGPFQDIVCPIGFWKNCEFLLETPDPRLQLYNLNTRELRAVEARRKVYGVFVYQIFIYKESLVSVKKEGCKCGPWMSR